MHKVLVVDDDKVLQQSVRQALEYHHFAVDVADNGKEAVNRVYGQKYDLVVMDVNMPEMDGIQALTEIKKHDPSVIVLILTAYSNVTDAVKAVKEGAYNYLEKPISAENLVALIEERHRRVAWVSASLPEDGFTGAALMQLREFTSASLTEHGFSTVGDALPCETKYQASSSPMALLARHEP